MNDEAQSPDSSAALEKMVSTFIGFWASDPVAVRRLRAMSALDPEIAHGIHARDARRARVAEAFVSLRD